MEFLTLVNLHIYTEMAPWVPTVLCYKAISSPDGTVPHGHPLRPLLPEFTATSRSCSHLSATCCSVSRVPAESSSSCCLAVASCCFPCGGLARWQAWHSCWGRVAAAVSVAACNGTRSSADTRQSRWRTAMQTWSINQSYLSVNRNMVFCQSCRTRTLSPLKTGMSLIILVVGDHAPTNLKSPPAVWQH